MFKDTCKKLLVLYIEVSAISNIKVNIFVQNSSNYNNNDDYVMKTNEKVKANIWAFLLLQCFKHFEMY